MRDHLKRYLDFSPEQFRFVAKKHITSPRFKLIYTNNYIYIEADGVSHNSSSYVHYIIDRNNNIEVYGMMGTNSTIALPVPMRDTNYYVNVTWDGGKSTTFYPSDGRVYNKTTTSFTTTMTRNSPNVQGTCWEVKGKIRTN